MPRQLYPYGTHDCRNLAGRTYADTVIRSELNRASIPIIKCDNDGEVTAVGVLTSRQSATILVFSSLSTAFSSCRLVAA